jgi:Putative bacterial sensory transduction regulator
VTTGPAVAAEVERFLREQAGALTVIGRSEDAWDVLVPSYWKETVAASLVLGDHCLRVEAFFMRSPEENHERVFRLLLQRNARSHLWKFTVNESGDASLIAEVPLSGVDDEGLDRLFGTLVSLVDDTYVPYMRLGYATSLAEQVRQGGPGIDQPPPWAREWEAVYRPPEQQRHSSGPD